MSILSTLRRGAIVAAVLAVLLGLLLSASDPRPVEALGKPELRRALLGTVRVAVPVDKQRDSYSTGSGTVLTADGYILTNFHVIGDKKSGKLYNQKGLAYIAVNPPDLKGLPTWMYQAVLVKGDAKTDLAVLKVSAPFKGGGSLPKNLGLVAVPIGDSDQVEIGDAVHVIGYPGIGGDSVTYTSGTIAGFLDDDEDRTIDWLKTDAEVNHGNSGGLAVNDAGEMIGVPTAGIAEPDASGKISLIRPISRALPLIKASIAASSTLPNDTTSSTKPRITRLVFSDSVDANNRPGKAATSFPAGTQTVYAVFDYAGFSNGARFEGVWYRDGKRDAASTLDWDAGESGSYWISIRNARGIITGTYDLIISLDGEELHKARMSVGVEATSSPVGSRFGPITFAEGVTAKSEPINPHKRGEPFESGSTVIYGLSTYQNMEDGLPWSHVWYVDGEQVLQRDNTWRWGAKGSFWVSISNKKGLPDGDYKLELYIGDELVTEAETSVGMGDQPLPTDDTVQVIGSIVDADTRRPIQGALFLVLNPGVDVRDWMEHPTDDDVYAGGETDSKGRFTLDEELERGETYALIAAARGYQPAYHRGYTVPDDAESPLEFNIKLQQR